VQVVMTEAAEQFITAVTLQALSGRPVFTSQWDARTAAGVDNNMPHINLSREADAILVAPASADFMAKLLHGRSDDLLSLMCLARPLDTVPLILAPAMNREMWAHPATVRNVAQLRADGTTVLDVGVGDQACGETGDGRMLEPDELLYELVRFFTPKVLTGQQVLVSAGPTFEAIDPVRGLTNLSSGKMGFAIARAAHEAGAQNFAAQKQVFGNRHGRGHGQVLVDGFNARAARVDGAAKFGRLAVQKNLALVGNGGTSQAFDEAGFARTVVANHGHDFSGAQLEVGTVQGGDLAVAFDQAFGLDHQLG
jgi:hypothetical protein